MGSFSNSVATAGAGQLNIGFIRDIDNMLSCWKRSHDWTGTVKRAGVRYSSLLKYVLHEKFGEN